MKITIESTSKIVELQLGAGTAHRATVPARIWEGTTERGTPVHCYITRICPTIPADELPRAVEQEFTADLREQAAPSAAVEGIPLRMIL